MEEYGENMPRDAFPGRIEKQMSAFAESRTYRDTITGLRILWGVECYYVPSKTKNAMQRTEWETKSIEIMALRCVGEGRRDPWASTDASGRKKNFLQRVAHLDRLSSTLSYPLFRLSPSLVERQQSSFASGTPTPSNLINSTLAFNLSHREVLSKIFVLQKVLSMI